MKSFKDKIRAHPELAKQRIADGYDLLALKLTMNDVTKIGDGEPDADGNITYDKYIINKTEERIDIEKQKIPKDVKKGV